MSNGDTINQVLDIFDGEEPELPKNVTNKILLVGMREVYRSQKESNEVTDRAIEQVRKEVVAVRDLAFKNSERLDQVERHQDKDDAHRAAINELLEDKHEADEEKKSARQKMLDNLMKNPFVAALLGGGAVKLLDLLFGG